MTAKRGTGLPPTSLSARRADPPEGAGETAPPSAEPDAPEVLRLPMVALLDPEAVARARIAARAIQGRDFVLTTADPATAEAMHRLVHDLAALLPPEHLADLGEALILAARAMGARKGGRPADNDESGRPWALQLAELGHSNATIARALVASGLIARGHDLASTEKRLARKVASWRAEAKRGTKPPPG